MILLLDQQPSIWTEIKNVVEGALGNLLWFSIGLLTILARRHLYGYLIIKRIALAFFSRRKYVLVWNDDKPELSATIIRKLQSKGLKKLRFKILKEPESILYFPADPRYVQMILLIVTDVTKLSEDGKTRGKIQNKLLNYVDNGGTLFGTHDLIYRRCRNTELFGPFGCQVNQFERDPNPIEVEQNLSYIGHPLLKDVPMKFSLRDGEVTTGDWSPETYPLVLTVDNYFADSLDRKVPVVCLSKTAFNGVLIWMSCGDKIKDDEHARSLDQPEFIQIIYNALRYPSDIRNFETSNQ